MLHDVDIVFEEHIIRIPAKEIDQYSSAYSIKILANNLYI